MRDPFSNDDPGYRLFAEWLTATVRKESTRQELTDDYHRAIQAGKSHPQAMCEAIAEFCYLQVKQGSMDAAFLIGIVIGFCASMIALGITAGNGFLDNFNKGELVALGAGPIMVSLMVSFLITWCCAKGYKAECLAALQADFNNLEGHVSKNPKSQYYEGCGVEARFFVLPTVKDAYTSTIGLPLEIESDYNPKK